MKLLEASAEISHANFMKKFNLIAKAAKKTGKKNYIDANLISQMVTSIVVDEMNSAKIDEEVFNKEIALQLELEQIENLLKKAAQPSESIL